jgi:sulfur carrier protein
MRVTIKLFATLREGRGKQLDIDIEEGCDVLKVLGKLDIKKANVSIVLVNGNNTGFDTMLSDGDTLSLFPPVGGG